MSSNPPADQITVKVGGKENDLFMSFGLLHELLAIVGDLPSIALIPIQAELRQAVLNAVFAPRDDKGRITTPLEIGSLKISAADVLTVCEWVGSHLLDFFLAAIEGAVRIHQPHQERLQGTSMLSGLGSPG